MAFAAAFKAIASGDISDREAQFLHPKLRRLEAEMADLERKAHRDETLDDLKSSTTQDGRESAERHKASLAASLEMLRAFFRQDGVDLAIVLRRVGEG